MTWRQYITILFSQIKQKDSIRDIVNGWSTFAARWYPGLGIISRNTLSHAHTKEDYRIFESLFFREMCAAEDKAQYPHPYYFADQRRSA